MSRMCLEVFRCEDSDNQLLLHCTFYASCIYFVIVTTTFLRYELRKTVVFMHQQYMITIHNSNDLGLGATLHSPMIF